MKRHLTRTVLPGSAAGVALWLLLLAADAVAGLRLTRLLLDISFLPQVSGPVPGWLEALLHLATAVALYAAFAWLAASRPRRWLVPLGILAGGLSSAIYIPLAAVSPTPPPPGSAAPAVWFVAHLLWGALVGLAIRKERAT